MRKSFISNIFAISFLVLMPSSVFASQAMPLYGVNEKTKECSEFFMGDECVGCIFPEGWKRVEALKCPNDYKEIHKYSVCTPRKTSFCCSVGHSGASGDCEDVVVNDVEKKCAFVEDINKCGKLPKNWKQAEETEAWGRICPSFEWLGSPLNCEEKIVKNNNTDNQKDTAKEQKNNISEDNLFEIIWNWFLLLFSK